MGNVSLLQVPARIERQPIMSADESGHAGAHARDAHARASALRSVACDGTVKAVRMTNVQFVESAARMRRNPARRHSASFRTTPPLPAASAR
jgi:hypothetical protein